jgi:SWI/SNF-related matrix-associated actin-dependent regulator of chromatin subfamily A3
MMEKEDPELPVDEASDAIQLWKRDARGRYVNIASNFVSSKPPQLLSGGILADDMGLGKTLQVISLILSDETAAITRGPTLIVAPVTVMSNWEQQVARHVLPEHSPRICIYHGAGKVSAEQLATHSIVITSYGTLAAENKPNATRVLLATNWRRVVLDEGHIIRNAKTATALAACEVRAHSRWVLTGTPM